jgi:hypothetical protein
MQAALRQAYRNELLQARATEGAGGLELALQHLARAHILSQRHTLAHAAIHLRMLRLGWRRRDGREVLGQLSRTLAALLFSRLWVPVGNTGLAGVSAFKPMPLPADLVHYLTGE